MTTATNTTTATTAASRPLYWGVDEQARAFLGLARLLDEYEQARWDHDDRERHEHSREGVQAGEAAWVATHGWLWKGLLEAQTQEDLKELAWACEERAHDRQDDGHGWAADVWEAVASYLWRLAA